MSSLTRTINPQRLDLVSLRLLLAIAQSGSITQAAAQCHLALGAASTRMRELEERLGVQLLERHARGVRLTEAGLIVLDRARAIEREIAQMTLELEDHRQGVTGHLRVVANVSSIATVLPQDLTAFMTDHPGLRIDLSEFTSREIQRMVAEGLADIGVLASQVIRPDLRHSPYYLDQLVAVVPPQKRWSGLKAIGLDELVKADLILFQEGGSISEWLADHARSQGVSLRVRVRSKGFDALAQLVAAGLGITVLPKIVAQRFAKLLGLRILPIAEIDARRTISICCRRDGPLLPAAQDLFQFLERQHPGGRV